jgi:hypothetical protein
MRKLLAGLVLGAALGSGAAFAAVHDLIARPGSRVTVQANRTYGTVVTFPGIDLTCTYGITKAWLGLEPARSRVLFCSRKSAPGSFDPARPQSRMVMVSRFRYYVTDNHRNNVYAVQRAP